MRSLLAAAGFVVVLGACGPRAGLTTVSPAEIPRLEALRHERPDDVDVVLRLGVAYERAGRGDDARVMLDAATRMPDAPAVAWLYLGALAERESDWEVALASYQRYADAGGPAAAEARGRVAYARRRLLAVEAQRALERESELSQLEPDPGVVAVMPMIVRGPDEYAALGRGLSEMLINDLSSTGRLTVLDRARVQALIDEMVLSVAGYTDPATGARTGRLLRARRVVQGELAVPSVDEVELSALVVDASDPDATAESRERGLLAGVLDLSVSLALSIYRDFGIELTSAELARLRERPTENLQAFLEYSRGLEALDRGQFVEAATRFRQAASIDPGFAAAAAGAGAADELADADAAGAAGVAAHAEAEVGEATAALGPEADAGATLESLANAAAPAGAAHASATADLLNLGAQAGVSRNASQLTYGEDGGLTLSTQIIPVAVRFRRPE